MGTLHCCRWMLTTPRGSSFVTKRWRWPSRPWLRRKGWHLRPRRSLRSARPRLQPRWPRPRSPWSSLCHQPRRPPPRLLRPPRWTRPAQEQRQRRRHKQQLRRRRQPGRQWGPCPSRTRRSPRRRQLPQPPVQRLVRARALEGHRRRPLRPRHSLRW